MPKSEQPRLALPTIYLLLATVATMVQWNKWQALHRYRNLNAFVLSVGIMLISATYLLRAFRDRRRAGL